jgi:glutathione S-transferase
MSLAADRRLPEIDMPQALAKRPPAVKKAVTARPRTPARASTVRAPAAPALTVAPQAVASLTISSRNYSSWSLRGWLLARFSGLPFSEELVSPDDADARKELLLLAPSIRVPCLTHDGAKVWNTLAIAQYLNEVCPDAGLMPADRIARAHCRSISGEMNSGFSHLRQSLPMNLRGDYPKHKVWSRALGDIERVLEIWRECLAQYGGPYLFGKQRCMADAMYAPVVTRFLTYHVALDPACSAYCKTIMAMPEMQEWVSLARAEPDEIDELDMDF